MRKKVIITGISGQDGSHMADYLIKHTDHMIYGAIRRLSVNNHRNFEHLKEHPRFQLINMDLTDSHSITNAVREIEPDYFINFAAQSFVAGSWDYPIQTWETDSNSVLHMLEAIHMFAPNCRFYNAGSSEEFGDVEYSPQDEDHPLRPQSPYGAAKCAARHLVRVYRESYNLFAIQGWLFNHEGTRRGLDFVTRKISHNVAKIKLAIEAGEPIPSFSLGNLEAMRDWSDAEDMMDGVWKMLNNETPQEFILASGEMHSVREFLETSLNCAGITFKKHGKDDNEEYLTTDGQIIMKINPEFYRPAEVHELLGDSSLAEDELGWVRHHEFEDLVRKMYENDYKLLKG